MFRSWRAMFVHNNTRCYVTAHPCEAVVYKRWPLTVERGDYKRSEAPLGEKKDCMESKIKSMDKTSSVWVESPFWDLGGIFHPCSKCSILIIHLSFMVDSAGERISSARVPVPVPVCQSARVPSQSVPPSTILSLSCLLPRCNQLHYIPYTAMCFKGVKWILSKMESTIQTSHIAVHWMFMR